MTNFEKITKGEDALAEFMERHGVCPPYEDKALPLCVHMPKCEFTCGDCWFHWLDKEAKVEP